MATLAAAKEIAHILPTFSGDPLFLESFINLVDKFYNTYGTTNDNTLSDFVFMAILSKLKEKAANVIYCQPDLNTWPDVRTALKNEFGDHADRNALTQDFMYLKIRNNENIISFINRVKQDLARLNVKTRSDGKLNVEERAIYIKNNEKLALDVILRNVDENLRTILMIRDPADLITAETHILTYVHANQRINMLKHVGSGPNKKFNDQKPRFYSNAGHSGYHSFQNNALLSGPARQPSINSSPQTSTNFNRSNFTNSGGQFPRGPVNMQTRPNFGPQFYPSHSQVFGKPKNVFAPNKNYRSDTNPQPMSIVSNRTIPSNFRNQNKFPNYGQQRNFISEELHNVDCDELNIVSEGNDSAAVDPVFPVIDEETEDLVNFPVAASETEQIE